MCAKAYTCSADRCRQRVSFFARVRITAFFYTIEKEFCCRKKKDYALYPHNPLAHLKFQLDKVRLENFKNSLSIVLCMDV